MKKNRVIRHISVRSTLLLIAVVILVGCAPLISPDGSTIPASTPVASAPSAPLLQPAIFSTSAVQCSSLFDTNLAHVYEVLESHIFWTWHLNFQPAPGEVLAAYPDAAYAGCLRFYWKDDALKTFTPASEYILTPCYLAVDDGSIVAQPPTTLPSTWGTPTVVQPLEFGGTDYIRCPLNLAESILAYTDPSHAAFADNMTDLEVSVSGAALDFNAVSVKITDDVSAMATPAHNYVYRLLSLAAATGSLAIDNDNQAEVDNAGVPLATHPLIYYRPNCANDPDCPQPVALAHAAYPNDNSRATAYGHLLGLDFTVDLANGDTGCETSASCSFEASLRDALGMYTVMEYGQTATDPGIDPCAEGALSNPPLSPLAQYYQFRFIAITSNMGSDWGMWCSTSITESVEANLQSGVPFWTGDAEIFVGYNPEDETYLKGSVYSTWLDPDSAVRPPD